MFNQVSNFLKRCLIYAIVLTLGLPVSVILMSGSAKASDSVKTKIQVVETTKTLPKPKEITSKNAVLPILTKIIGLNKNNVYFEGDRLNWQLTFNNDNLRVWVDLDNLDPNMPNKLYPSFVGNGVWNFISPKFSDELIAGGHIVKITAQDLNGNVTTKIVKIVLKNIPNVKIVGSKLSGNTIFLTWEPIPSVDSYLVEWKAQNENTTQIKNVVKGNTIRIDNLKNGASYSLTVSAVIGEAIGKPSEISFKIGGVLAPEIAGTATASNAQSVTPSIGEQGVSSRNLAQSQPTSQVTPKSEPKKEEVTTSTPTPTPSAENKATTGGWSKLLIALSILIIAAGAAIGGYYGYEWLMTRGKEDKEPPESSSRW